MAMEPVFGPVMKLIRELPIPADMVTSSWLMACLSTLFVDVDLDPCTV